MNLLFKIIIIIISINVSILISQCDSLDTSTLPRDGTNAALIGDKIYYIGGRREPPQKIIPFILDLSSDFTAVNANFIQVVGLENMPSSPAWTAACLEKNNTIYIFGGTDGSQAGLPKLNTLYKIEPSGDNSLNWIKFSPNQGDIWPSARDGIFPIIDKLSRIFVWGGRNEGQDNKTMYMFEANQWQNYTLDNAPDPRASYSATLLDDGRIIYIGGNSSDPYPDVNFLELLIFDTTKLEWSTQLSTSNEPIKNRQGHSALLHMDSTSIIMYGGFYVSDGEIPDSDSVWILSTTKNWTWSRPSVPSLPSITVTRGHTAVIHNGYMVIAFGTYGTNYSYTSEVKVMDVTNLNSLAWIIPHSEYSAQSENLRHSTNELIFAHTSTDPPLQQTNLRPISYQYNQNSPSYYYNPNSPANQYRM
ncbi:692_t:CDS:2 [Ambispora gerdemannii]|uniref:692_t:CDS:1 n=1 Tax=Ambispora gerdemannii TaxID=144530 RepID=A0A9N9AQL0_9GLOM|nr:692_t:CDS:2 [Ambispora gerdemannii]